MKVALRSTARYGVIERAPLSRTARPAAATESAKKTAFATPHGSSASGMNGPTAAIG
jgi:hypothetical protein